MTLRALQEEGGCITPKVAGVLEWSGWWYSEGGRVSASVGRDRPCHRQPLSRGFLRACDVSLESRPRDARRAAAVLARMRRVG